LTDEIRLRRVAKHKLKSTPKKLNQIAASAIQRGWRKRPSEAIKSGVAILDGGGKRSATPLSDQTDPLGKLRKALSPLRSASAVQNLTVPGVRGGAGGWWPSAKTSSGRGRRRWCR